MLGCEDEALAIMRTVRLVTMGSLEEEEEEGTC
jgi:hypothetical protein